MPSPFPGMDPYMEDPAFWPGFHGELIYACRALLLDRLPPQYDADVNEQVRLYEASDNDAGVVEARDVIPDVTVTRQPGPGRGSGGPSPDRGGAAVLSPALEPVVIVVPTAEEVRQRWIAIRHLPDNTLVTAIEVFSPTNKAGDGFGDYQAKRQALLRQRTNLVELDLLVGGRRPDRSPDLPRADYYALVSRADAPGRRFVYAWPVRRPLPTIPVPLKAPDPDVPLDLSAAFATAYDRGRYHRRLRYADPPPAPLQDADKSWAVDVVRRSATAPGGPS